MSLKRDTIDTINTRLRNSNFSLFLKQGEKSVYGKKEMLILKYFLKIMYRELPEFGKKYNFLS